ncbi:MAG TPA: helix-turn-helix domain-containing protein, partial [Geminicoccaceae bacterium]
MLKRRSQPPAEAQDRSEETARSIGRLLRETRMARGEELGDVAEFLRIRPGYLAALEAGELAAIPGRPYAIGFLRAYGGYLGLDGDGLVGRLKAAIDH